MIQHVALEVREADVDACVAFWGLLGFARVPAGLPAFAVVGLPDGVRPRSRGLRRL